MIIAIVLVFLILIAILVYAILGGSICSREDVEKK